MTSDACAWVEANAADLVRPTDLPDHVTEHFAACADCRAVADGARTLQAELDAWAAPEPPAGLLDRTFAGLAMAHIQTPAPAATETTETTETRSPAPAGGVIPFPTPDAPRRRRRTTVEVLTDAQLRNPTPTVDPPSQRQLLWRLVAQAAAALVLFGVCTTFAAVFYPAVAQALEDRRVHDCQARLVRLQKSALLYHAEHPQSGDLRGPKLRQALIQGGYADPHDFECPGKQGSELKERSFWGYLPGGKATIPSDTPIYWDRFGNHSTGFNVVYADGRIETVRPEALERFSSLGRNTSK